MERASQQGGGCTPQRKTEKSLLSSDTNSCWFSFAAYQKKKKKRGEKEVFTLFIILLWINILIIDTTRDESSLQTPLLASNSCERFPSIKLPGGEQPKSKSSGGGKSKGRGKTTLPGERSQRPNQLQEQQSKEWSSETHHWTWLSARGEMIPPWAHAN